MDARSMAPDCRIVVAGWLQNGFGTLNYPGSGTDGKVAFSRQTYGSVEFNFRHVLC